MTDIEMRNAVVKELDVAMHGDEAAEQASLCDLIGQWQNERRAMSWGSKRIAELEAVLFEAEKYLDHFLCASTNSDHECDCGHNAVKAALRKAVHQ